VDVYSTGQQMGTLNVNEPVQVNGIMLVDANLVQASNPYAHIQIGGGRLMLAGSATGGSIAITSGTLEFSQSPGFIHGPETASEQFGTHLAFTGQSGAVQFDGVGSLMIGIHAEDERNQCVQSRAADR
jgi:hypothetical protein